LEADQAQDPVSGHGRYEKLVKDVIAALDSSRSSRPRISSQTADVEVVQAKTSSITESGQAHPDPADRPSAAAQPCRMIEDLIAHITPPIKLTRRTRAAIVTGIKNRQAALDNPQEFARPTARSFRENAIKQLVDASVREDGTWYEMTRMGRTGRDAFSDRSWPVENSIYDHIVVQSDTERKFAEKLKKMKTVRLFVKLAGWFKCRRRLASTTRIGRS